MKSNPKMRTVFLCRECGAAHPKWAGQCNDCGAWNTLEQAAAPAVRARGYAGAGGERTALERVDIAKAPRLKTAIAELDRVLGGGIVPGSAILIGGEPGIGKSTLLLQVLAGIAGAHPALYVSGEESLAQLALRARRLNLAAGGIECMTETRLEAILAAAQSAGPTVLVIDSIQTIAGDDSPSAPGSVSQVRDSALALTRYAKQTGCVLFLIGHVTKEGQLAGPRVLEHMVDTVLYFESDSGSRFRLLRAVKNRFGAVNELGVFAMSDQGLREVPNPSAIFLSERDAPVPGSAVLVSREGTRPLLVEVQALVDENRHGTPRRVALGIETNRLLLLLAVMHRHGGLAIHDQDVFVNIVGGLRVQETAADLALALAVWSSLRGRPLPAGMASFGEIGLAGELRPVPDGEARIRAAAGQGLSRIVLPKANTRGLKPPPGVTLLPAARLSEALALAAEQ